MKVNIFWSSLVSHTQPMVPPNLLILMMITDAESFSKSAWDSRSKLIPSDKNSKATSLELMEVLIRTDSPWSRVSSVTTESSCYSHLEHQDIVSREKEKEKEDQLEDVLLDLILRLFLLPLLKKEKKKFPDWLIRLKIEDLDPKELLASESSMVLKNKLKRPLKIHVLWSKRTVLEELSRAKRMLRLQDTKPQKFKDWSLNQD